MAVAYRSGSFDVPSSDTDTSLVVTAPSGMAAGDVLVAFAFCITARTISPPTGFTQRQATNNTDYRGYVWTKTAAGGDDLTFTASGTFGSPTVAVLAISGGTEDDIASAIATSTVNDNSAEAPSVTTVAADSLVLTLAGSARPQTSTCTGPTEAIDETGGSFGSHVAAYYETQASAGATPGRTVNLSGFSRWVAATVAIKPSGGGTPSVSIPVMAHHYRQQGVQ